MKLRDRFNRLFGRQVSFAFVAALMAMSLSAAETNINGVKVTYDGATLSDAGGEKVLTFTHDGSFAISEGGTAKLRIFAVGGGGGGGSQTVKNIGAGGGGAGGVVESTDVIFNAGTYYVGVGKGGAKHTGLITGTAGMNGGFSLVTNAANRVFISAMGGAGGGASGNGSTVNGQNGASGGGATWNATTHEAGVGGRGNINQGNAGGTPTSAGVGAGGGGAGGAGGADGTAGAGLVSDITGANVTYAKGGKGGVRYPTAAAADAVDGFGNGGDGGSTDGTEAVPGFGGKGGDGVVIVRFSSIYQVQKVPYPIYTTNFVIAASATHSSATAFDKAAYDTAHPGAIAELKGTNTVSDIYVSGSVTNGYGRYKFTLTLNEGYAWDNGTAYGDMNAFVGQWRVVTDASIIDATIGVSKEVEWGEGGSNATVRITSYSTPGLNPIKPKVLFLGGVCGAHSQKTETLQDALDALSKTASNIDCYLVASTNDHPDLAKSVSKGVHYEHIVNGKTESGGSAIDVKSILQAEAKKTNGGDWCKSGGALKDDNHCVAMQFFEILNNRLTKSDASEYDYIVMEFDGNRIMWNLVVNDNSRKILRGYFNTLTDKLLPYYKSGKVLWIVDDSKSASASSDPFGTAYYTPSSFVMTGGGVYTACKPNDGTSSWRFGALALLLDPGAIGNRNGYSKTGKIYKSSGDSDAITVGYIDSKAVSGTTIYCLGRNELQTYYNDAKKVVSYIETNITPVGYNLQYNDTIQTSVGLTIEAADAKILTNGAEGYKKETLPADNDAKWTPLFTWDKSMGTEGQMTEAGRQLGITAYLTCDKADNHVSLMLTNMDFAAWTRLNIKIADNGNFKTSVDATWNPATQQWEKNPNKGMARVDLVDGEGNTTDVYGEAETSVEWKFTTYNVSGAVTNGTVYLNGLTNGQTFAKGWLTNTIGFDENYSPNVTYRGNPGFKVSEVYVNGELTDAPTKVEFATLDEDKDVVIYFESFVGTYESAPTNLVYDGEAHVFPVEFKDFTPPEGYDYEVRYALNENAADDEYLRADDFAAARKATDRNVGTYTYYYKLFVYQPGYGAAKDIDEFGWVAYPSDGKHNTVTITPKPLTVTAKAMSLPEGEETFPGWQGATYDKTALVTGDTVNEATLASTSDILQGDCPTYQPAKGQYPLLLTQKADTDLKAIAGANYEVILRDSVVSVKLGPISVGPGRGPDGEGVPQYPWLDPEADDTGVDAVVKVYDGTPTNLVVEVTKPSDPGQYEITYTTTPDDPTSWGENPPFVHAGTNQVWYAITPKGGAEESYFPATNYQYVIILPRPLTLTAASDAKPFDGTALVKNEAAVTAGSLAPGDSIADAGCTGTQTAIGSSANEIDPAKLAFAVGYVTDYELTLLPGELTVSPAPMTFRNGAGEEVRQSDDPDWPLDANEDGVDDLVTCYDGTGKHLLIDVVDPADGAGLDFAYSLDGVNWTSEGPLTNVCGKTQMYFAVTDPAGGYVAVTNFGYVTITQRVVTVYADDKTIALGDPEPEYTYSVSNAAPCDAAAITELIASTVTCPTYADAPDTYPIVPTGATSQGNYAVGAWINGTLTVLEPKTIVYTAEGAEKVYDGQPTNIMVIVTDPTDGFDIYYTTNDWLTVLTNEPPVYVNAGSNDVFFAIEKRGYTSVTNSRPVVILPREISAEDGVVADPTNMVYGADAPDLANHTWTGPAADALAAGDGIKSVSFAWTNDVAAIKALDVGEYADIITTNAVAPAIVITNAVGADVTANYVMGFKPGTLTVTKDRGFVEPIADDPTGRIYKGEGWEPEVTVTNSVGETLVEDVDYTTEYFDNTNATEEAYVVVTFTRNYGGVATNYFTIHPKAVTLTTGTKTDFVYDGEPHAYTNLTAEGFVAGEGLATTTDWATVTTVGEGTNDNTVAYTLAGNTLESNYTISVVTGELAVVAAKIKTPDEPTNPEDPIAGPPAEDDGVTLWATNVVKVYDGLGTNVVAFVYNAPAGNDFTYEYSSDGTTWAADDDHVTFTNVLLKADGSVDSYKVFYRAVPQGNAPNYIGTNCYAWVTILPREISAEDGVVADPTNMVYGADAPDLANHTWTGPAADALAAGDGVKSVSFAWTNDVAAIKALDVGEYADIITTNAVAPAIVITNAVGADVTANYVMGFKPGALTVTKDRGFVEPIADDPTGRIYKGEGWEPEVTVTNTVGETLVEDVDYTTEYFDNTNATEEAYVVVTFTGNYEGVATNYFTIHPKAVTLTTGTKTDFVYDGEPHAYTNLTAEGFVAGEGLATTTDWATVTTVAEGTNDNTVAYTLAGNTLESNYTISVVTGELAVVAAKIKTPDEPTDPDDPIAGPPAEDDGVTLWATNVVKVYDGLGTNVVAFVYNAPAGNDFTYEYSSDGTTWAADDDHVTFTNVLLKADGSVDSYKVFYRAVPQGNAPNYIGTNCYAWVTILPREISAEDGVVADPTNMVYGADAPDLANHTWTGPAADALAAGDCVKSVSFAWTNDVAAIKALDVGEYADIITTNAVAPAIVITNAVGADVTANYVMGFKPGTLTVDNATIKKSGPNDPEDETPPGPDPNDPDAAWAGAPNIVKCFDNEGTNVVAAYGNLIPAGVEPEVLYSTNETDWVAWEKLLLTNVCDAVEVFFTVTVDNYNVLTNSAYVTITNAVIRKSGPNDPEDETPPGPDPDDPDAAWAGAPNIVKCYDGVGTNITAVYGNILPEGAEPEILYSLSEEGPFAERVADQFVDITEPTPVYFTVTVDNYNVLTNFAYVTITNATIKKLGPNDPDDPFDPPAAGAWAGAYNVVKCYDGVGTNIVAEYGGFIPEGADVEVLYALDENGPYAERVADRFVDVTNEVPVYFTVTAPNYGTITNFAYVTITNAVIKKSDPKDPEDETPPGPDPEDPEAAWAGAPNIVKCFDNEGTNVVAAYGNLIPAGVEPEVLYSTNETDWVAWEKLQLTNVCDAVEVFFTVTVDNYNVLTNSAYVTITNAVINPFGPKDPDDPTEPGPDEDDPDAAWAGAQNIIKCFDGIGTNIVAVYGNILPEDAEVEILYSLAEEGPYAERVADQFVEITDGPVPVYFTVSAPNYTTLTNMAYVTITNALIKPIGPNDPDDPLVPPETGAWAGALNIVKCYDGVGTNIVAEFGGFIPADAEVTVLYALEEQGAYGERVADQFVDVTNEVPVYFTVSAPNYGTITNHAFVTITNATITKVGPSEPGDPSMPEPPEEGAWCGATNVVKVYDGNPTNITVVTGGFLPEDPEAVIQYSLDPEGPFGDENPSFTSVTNVEVFFTVEVPNYGIVTNSAWITIAPGFPRIPEEGPGEVGPFSEPPTGPAPLPDVTAGTIVSSNDYVGVYDGEAHTIDTNRLWASLAEDPLLWANGPKVTYSLTGADGTWQDDPFTWTDAVTTSFWYCVEAPNFSNYYHAAGVTITQRVVTIVFPKATKVFDGTPDCDPLVTNVVGEAANMVGEERFDATANGGFLDDCSVGDDRDFVITSVDLVASNGAKYQNYRIFFGANGEIEFLPTDVPEDGPASFGPKDRDPNFPADDDPALRLPGEIFECAPLFKAELSWVYCANRSCYLANLTLECVNTTDTFNFTPGRMRFCFEDRVEGGVKKLALWDITNPGGALTDRGRSETLANGVVYGSFALSDPTPGAKNGGWAPGVSKTFKPSVNAKGQVLPTTATPALHVYTLNDPTYGNEALVLGGADANDSTFIGWVVWDWVDASGATKTAFLPVVNGKTDLMADETAPLEAPLSADAMNAKLAAGVPFDDVADLTMRLSAVQFVKGQVAGEVEVENVRTGDTGVPGRSAKLILLRADDARGTFREVGETMSSGDGRFSFGGDGSGSSAFFRVKFVPTTVVK